MMEQNQLRQWERLCIQDEPAPCVAACPLHVDVRTLTGHVADGNWTKAQAVLNKTMPLPTILGRICDAPCQVRCNRTKLGGAVRIGALERAIVSREDKLKRMLPLPKKPTRVAVIGSGLSSLTVAWDLSRKGYDLTLFETADRIGGRLIDQFQEHLSSETIEGEVKRIAQLGVHVETGAALDAGKIKETFAAVYVGLDGISETVFDLAPSGPLSEGRFAGDTGTDGVFAGGGYSSPVWQAASGRWCATSMDRWLQKVSMEAGRENEGPYETRLITNLEGIEPVSTVHMADPRVGYSQDEARDEAERCLQCQCLECVKACDYLKSFGGHPKTYAREIYNNLSIAMGERKSNKLINSCSLCGLCEVVCPNNFAMQDLCLAARQSMVARGKMPPSAHDFALQDMAFANSDRFALARHAPGTESSSHLFFPGCQLCASSPRQVTRVYNYLREKITGGVALMLGCCGAPAHWAGREALFSEELAKWEAQWIGLGRPRPIMACSTCLRVFTDHLPECGAVSLWEVLETTVISDAGVRLPNGPLAVHDPCTTRDVPAVQASVRRLLHCTGVPIEELTLGRDKTECCGFGGLMQAANPELSREVADRRGKLSGSDFVAYCAMCRDNLAAVGKRTLHLLDLFFPDPQVADPAARPRPGWSRRRENRLRLKAELCRSLWGEKSVDDPDGHETIELLMDADVEALLDSRRILEEDIRRVIAHAQADGSRFRHKESGHFLAAFRPYHATFWVEYAPEGEGFRVHNAYAHRMEVLGP